jgi:hypothetical protein
MRLSSVSRVFRRPRGPLPKPEEAFTLPIPVELTAKQQQLATASSATSSLPTPTASNLPSSQSIPAVVEPPLPLPTTPLTGKLSFYFSSRLFNLHSSTGISKPPIDVLRIDQRLLAIDPSIRPKRIKAEPRSSFISSTSSTDLQKLIKHASSALPPLPVSYLPDGHIPAPPPAPKKPAKDLNPATPSVMLETRREATSVKLQQYCLSQPICIVRSLANVLKLDLGLFSTKTLVETHPDHSVEVRTQRQQACDENFDFSSMTMPLKNVWKYQSTRSFTTIAKYAQYQAYSYHDMVKDELNDSLLHPTNLTGGLTGNSSMIMTNGTGKKLSNKQPSKPKKSSDLCSLINMFFSLSAFDRSQFFGVFSSHDQIRNER